MQETAEAVRIAEEEGLRADLYDFLAAFLARPPSEQLLAHARCLSGDNETEIGRAVVTLERIAGQTTERKAKSEFERLFIGLGRGELMPYASFYLTGFLNEKPLAALRDDMRRLGIRRAESVREPEDGIASLCEMMAGLIRGRFGPVASLVQQREFFGRHLGPWARHFFSDLEGAKGSVLYAPVGTMGRAFMEIERDAFRMAN